MSLPFLPPDATGIELSFWLSAVGGSFFFLFRVMLVLVGGFADDFDAIDDAEFDDSSGDAQHSEAAFKLISLNTVSAFMMMFGWSGLTSALQFQLPMFAAIAIGLAVGAFAMYVTALLYMFALRLASKGADFSIQQTVGRRASVYQRIPEDGIGKIQVVVNDMTHELSARADCAVESFVTVEVLEAIDDSTVTVKPIDLEEGV